jgi:hypothetical protein
MIINSPVKGTTLVCSYPVLRLVFGSTSDTTSAIVRALVIGCVLPFLVLIAAAFEHSLVLSEGTGVLQHAGFFSFVVTAPLIPYLTWALLQRTAFLLAGLPRFSATGNLPAPLRRIVRQKLLLIGLRTRMKFTFVLGSVIGLFYVILNARWVMDAETFYGTPTFDSPDHLLVFVVNRVYVAFMLVIITPTALFACLSITSMMHRILKFMSNTDILEIDLFHSDNCGGLSEFGSLNATIMAIYVCILANIIMNMESHESEVGMLLLPLMVMSTLIILQSIAAVYYIHKCIQAKRREALRVVNEKLNSQFRELRVTGHFSDELLAVRNHLITIRSFPYSTHVLGFVNLLRAAPALLAVLRAVLR